ncbi:hypothetical protein [Alicyclobacillus kakegawensis]|uniref:hypothetical protein n=1 Tax=Alicyclobacillus kakegawensis TaxID=392012 RepID=UPI00082956A4|nr:hypothetical protein [Alicyclobacillus kakegawensis]
MPAWVDQGPLVLKAFGAPEDLLTEYAWRGPLRLRAARGGVKIRTDSGSFWLRRARVGREQLQAAHLCAEAVHAHGWRPVPRFVRTLYGDPYVVDASGLYYVTPWFPGSVCRFRERRQMQQAVETLAAWQRAALGSLPVADVPPGSTPSAWTDCLRQGMDEVRRMEAAANGAGVSPFQRLVASVADQLKRRLDEAAAQLQRIEFSRLEETAKAAGHVCHGRFHGDALWNDGTVAVVDYEQVHPGLPETDLASWMQRYLPQHDWDVEWTCQLVDQYLNARNVANGERSDAVRVLAALLTIPMPSLQLVRWYVHGALHWDEDDYVDALEAGLEREEGRIRAIRELLRRHALASTSRGKREEIATAAAAPMSPSPDPGETVHAVASVVVPTDEGVVPPAEMAESGAGLVSTAESEPEATLQIRLSPTQRERLQQIQQERRRMREHPDRDRGIRLWGDARSLEESTKPN